MHKRMLKILSIMMMLIIICGSVWLSTPLAANLLGKNAHLEQSTALSHRPAPTPFEYPLVLKADPFPAHPSQKVQLQPKDTNWTGKYVTIYLLEGQDFLYSKKVPAEAQKIGTCSIQNGTWTFDWKIPTPANNMKFSSFMIAAVSDSGIVSGKEIGSLNYETLELSTKIVNIGDQVTINGSGFYKDSDIEIRLEKDEHSPYTNAPKTIAKLGTFHSKDGSFKYSFEINEFMEGNQVSAGDYNISVIVIPNNAARERVDTYFQIR